MLVLQDIAVTYQSIVPAVQSVSLEVPEKAIVALLGANRRAPQDSWALQKASATPTSGR